MLLAGLARLRLKSRCKTSDRSFSRNSRGSPRHMEDQPGKRQRHCVPRTYMHLGLPNALRQKACNGHWESGRDIVREMLLIAICRRSFDRSASRSANGAILRGKRQDGREKQHGEDARHSKRRSVRGGKVRERETVGSEGRRERAERAEARRKEMTGRRGH